MTPDRHDRRRSPAAARAARAPSSGVGVGRNTPQSAPDKQAEIAKALDAKKAEWDKELATKIEEKTKKLTEALESTKAELQKLKIENKQLRTENDKLKTPLPIPPVDPPQNPPIDPKK